MESARELRFQLGQLGVTEPEAAEFAEEGNEMDPHTPDTNRQSGGSGTGTPVLRGFWWTQEDVDRGNSEPPGPVETEEDEEDPFEEDTGEELLLSGSWTADSWITDEEDEEDEEASLKPSGRERGIAVGQVLPIEDPLRALLPFYPVHRVRFTETPAGPPLLSLSPPPLKRYLKRRPDPVEDFYTHVYGIDGRTALRFAVRNSAIVATYYKTKPLEEDGFTTFERSCLSGGFIAPGLVLSNMHGVRLQGSALVKHEGLHKKGSGATDPAISFIQVASGVQALRGNSGLQSHFEDSSIERYLLKVPEVVTKTDSREAQKARFKGKKNADKLLNEVDEALAALMDGNLPETKDPVTMAQFVDSESLDPDAVALTQYAPEKKPEVPAEQKTSGHHVAYKKLKTLDEGDEFSSPSLWFDTANGDVNGEKHLSLYLVGCPGQRAYKDSEIVDFCPEYVAKYVKNNPKLTQEEAIKEATIKLRLKVQAAHADEGVGVALGAIAKSYSRADVFDEAGPSGPDLSPGNAASAPIPGPSSGVAPAPAADVRPSSSIVRPRPSSNEPDRMVASDEYLGTNAFTTPGWSASFGYATKGPAGSTIGLHCGPAHIPPIVLLWTKGRPWGQLPELPDVTIHPPWNVMLPFSSASLFLRVIFDMYLNLPPPSHPYWTTAGSLGVVQLGPFKRLQEFHLYHLARSSARIKAPKEAVEAKEAEEAKETKEVKEAREAKEAKERREAHASEWISYVVAHHDLDRQLRTPVAGTPPQDELSFLSKKKVAHQLAAILGMPEASSSELLRKLKGEERNKSIGAISDYMRVNEDVLFDLSDWPFPFLKVRSFATLRWLVGRIVRPDTCTNYVNPDILAESLVEKEPDTKGVGVQADVSKAGASLDEGAQAGAIQDAGGQAGSEKDA